MKKFKIPQWDDIENFWNNCCKEERLIYIEDSLDCEETSKIAQAIADSSWDEIPINIAEIIDGYSQLDNDVFDELNKDIN